jgi:hypothetical protein
VKRREPIKTKAEREEEEFQALLALRPVDWLPEPGIFNSEPRRRVPSVDRILRYWLACGFPFSPHADKPACFACHIRYSEWRGLERAHLVAHCRGGPEIEPNFALLCGACHRMQPDQTYHEAVTYITSGGWAGVWQRQMVANGFEPLVFT